MIAPIQYIISLIIVSLEANGLLQQLGFNVHNLYGIIENVQMNL